VHHYGNSDLRVFTGVNKFILAQLNYCMVINLPSNLSDEPVMNLPVASITARYIRPLYQAVSEGGRCKYENLWEVDCDSSQSMVFEGSNWVALYNIMATPLAIVPCKVDGCPVVSNEEELSKLLFFAVKRNKACLHDINMLKLVHPYHNLNVMGQIKQYSVTLNK
jgi:hypothetical protein